MPQHDRHNERLILETLHAHRTMTMERLVMAIPNVSWNRVFHAIDELSRAGRIAVHRRGFEYELSLPASRSQPRTAAA